MKTPQEIISEMKLKSDSKQERVSTASLLKVIIQDAKDFFTNLVYGFGDKVSKSKFNVEVKNPLILPDVFRVDGLVSLKDTKALLIGLNEIVRGIEATKKNYEAQTKQLEKSLKPEKVDFTRLEQVIKDIYIPEPLKKISIDNFIDYTKKLDAIQKEIAKLKLNPEIKVNNPTSKVSIDLEGVKNQLQTVIEALSKTEEQPTGLSWTKNSSGNLSTLTETYHNGKVVSEGWDIGRVTINDQRSR